MCLLTVMSPGSTPTREQLLEAACNNPHGFGYAIMFEDRIVTGRGMDAEEIIDRFLAIRERCPETWAMFHHRYTTHGDTNKSNCHPFRVGGNPDIVLAHNGIIPVDMPVGDRRSDTRVFAEDELPHLIDWLDDEQGYAMLEDYIGWSKVCIFSLDPALKDNVYILNESSGHWDNGIWWSNDSYKPSRWSPSFRSYSSWEYDYDDDLEVAKATSGASCGSRMSGWWLRSETQQCLFCSSNLTDGEWEWGYCDWCKACLECAQDIIQCECDRGDYEPAGKQYKYWWEEVEEGMVIG